MKSFTTALAQEAVKIDDEGFALVEISGTQRDKYMQGMSGRMRFGKDGKPAGIKNFDGMQASLLDMCLHHAELDETDPENVTVVSLGARVSQGVIQKWGSKMQTELFQMAQVICGMNDDAEEEAKND